MAAAGAIGSAWRRLAWRLERRWYGHADPRPLRRGLGLGGVLSLAALGFVLYASHEEKQRLEAELAELQAEMDRLAAIRPAPAVPRDFVADLPTTAPAHAFIQHVEREAKALNVRVASIQSGEPRAQGEHLSYVELVLNLQGQYPDIKLLLKQVLERYPGSTVARLSMKRAEAQAIDATAVLRLWSRRVPRGAASLPGSR